MVAEAVCGFSALESLNSSWIGGWLSNGVVVLALRHGPVAVGGSVAGLCCGAD
jgi:hypothetical protein